MIILLSTTSFASNNKMIDSKEVISPKFTYSNIFHHNFDVSTNGKSSLSVYLDAYSVDQMKVVASLQKYDNGNWRTIKRWSVKNNEDSAGLGKSYYITRSNLYGLKSYVNVSNRLVEMD